MIGKSLTITMLSGLFAIGTSCNTPPERKLTTVENPVSEPEEEVVVPSPRQQAEGKIGEVIVKVDYGSPGVKGRVIWGGLEEYGKVWRAGANETTSFEFSDKVMIGGKQLPAGKYGFYLIPEESSEWIAIINSDWNRQKHGAWGAYNYNKAHDIVRVKLQPQFSDENQKRLEYIVTENSIDLKWEKVKVSLPIAPVIE